MHINYPTAANYYTATVLYAGNQPKPTTASNIPWNIKGCYVMGNGFIFLDDYDYMPIKDTFGWKERENEKW